MAKATGAKPSPPKKATPPKRAFGRSLSDFPRLSAAEKKLVACCAGGEPCVLGDGMRPEKATAANTIRAGLIRFLALGGDGDNPVHEEGVMLWGAWVKGKLNLHQATAVVRLQLRKCHFDNTLNFMSANLPALVLSGCSVPGINADGMSVKANVFLDDSFEASGEIRLLGAHIGGQLYCKKSSFTNEGGYALNADRMSVMGSVFLNDGFEASGEVRLLGAQIGGDFSCKNGSFTNEGGEALCADRMTVKGNAFLDDGFKAKGKVRLLGAQIGGDFSCKNGSFTNEGGEALCADRMTVKGNAFLDDGFKAKGEVRFCSVQIGDQFSCEGGSFDNEGGEALNTQGMSVKGVVLLRDALINGAIDLTAAKIGTLADDADAWQAGGHLLDGLHYDRIIGPTDAKMRTKWLKQQRSDQLNEDFAPQPWEQLIKVLREMGHPEDAAKVAIAKQDQWRAATKTNKRKFGEKMRRGLHWLYGWIAGYGYRPIWTVYWMMGVWISFAFVYENAAQRGAMAPANPVMHSHEAGEIEKADSSYKIISNVNVTGCGVSGDVSLSNFWNRCPGMPPEYTTFNALFYSLDLILPLVDLQQDSDWAPVVMNGKTETLWPGWWARSFMWFEILFGWVASLTLVAVLGRLVDKD